MPQTELLEWFSKGSLNCGSAPEIRSNKTIMTKKITIFQKILAIEKNEEKIHFSLRITL